MPTRFDSLGVDFQYPDNWTLDDSDARLGRRSVTVYSPGGGFWSLAVHPVSADPIELVESIVGAIKSEYDCVEVQQVRETVAGRELVGCNLAFFCLDLTNTAVIRSFRGVGSTYTVFYQAEDREFDRIDRVFQAMTTSLVANMGGNV